LLILHANPTQGIPDLAAALDAQAAFWNWDVEPDASPTAIALLRDASKKRAFKFSQKLD